MANWLKAQRERCASSPPQCPVLEVEQARWVLEALQDARSVEKGVMRVEGGIDAQPARWWEAVKLVLHTSAQIDQEQIEEARNR